MIITTNGCNEVGSGIKPNLSLPFGGKGVTTVKVVTNEGYNSDTITQPSSVLQARQLPPLLRGKPRVGAEQIVPIYLISEFL